MTDEVLMNVARIIADKRDGKELTNAQIEHLISGFARAEIPDYQMAAFAMAVFFQGMTDDETEVLTRCMIESGDTLAGREFRPSTSTPPAASVTKSQFPWHPCWPVAMSRSR